MEGNRNKWTGPFAVAAALMCAFNLSAVDVEAQTRHGLRAGHQARRRHREDPVRERHRERLLDLADTASAVHSQNLIGF